MGGGLAFLTKKSFNPANWRNQREVWEARQNAETEKRRISERDAQLKREREEEDLARVVGGEEGGGRKALSFMYDAGKVPGLERKKGGDDDEDYNNGKQNQQVGETSLYERQPGDDDAAAAFRAMLAKGIPTETEQSDNVQQSMTAGEAALKGDGEEESKTEDEKDFKPDNRTKLEKAVGRGINSGSGLTLAQQMERFPMLKGAPVALEKGKGGDDKKETDDATSSLVFKPFGSQIRNVKCLKCGKWGHSKGDRECEAEWNPFNMTSSIPTAAPQPPVKCETAPATTVAPERELAQKTSSDEQRDKRDKKRRRKDDRKHRKKKKHKSHHKRRRKRSRYYSSDESSTSSHSSDDSDSTDSRRHRRKESSKHRSSTRRLEKKRSKHERRRHRSPSSSVSVTILATICLLPTFLLGTSNAFNYLGMSSTKRKQLTTRLFNSEDTRLDEKLATAPPKDALALLDEAKKLRAEASMIQQQLILEKEERIRKERAKVDSLIDALLFHGSNTERFGDDSESEAKSKQQLINTEEQVADLLISKRLSYEMVNQMFDRICEQSNRPQSIDSCSPLLSLLLDASCKVDVIERKDNPNKRWNQRVERDLRRKLFALGYGIRIEDVEKEKNGIRSIHGDRDLCH